MRHTPLTGGDRGQTGIDFVIGIGIFMLAVGFLVGIAPSMVAPHSDTPELPLVSDRAANRAVSLMQDPAENTGVLHTECTDEFFSPGTTSCPRDMTVPIVDSRYDVEVTLTDIDGTVLKSRGTQPPDGTTSVATARRVVVYNDDPVYLRVRVWP